jgi:hypothetical protein
MVFELADLFVFVLEDSVETLDLLGEKVDFGLGVLQFFLEL